MYYSKILVLNFASVIGHLPFICIKLAQVKGNVKILNKRLNLLSLIGISNNLNNNVKNCIFIL
jgi:hypothetical protein